ncbi:MAG: DNA polymerase III subunit epsilon [Rhodospirillales bacterium RIFCSPLOWO2_12_FULL_58_28]|nr:MAG: DNA polymerase III subunit epsilon [Rhodospirillales bacterium RIFCSPLOWO2_02_FULL_58_16]OHC79861.1 MAG: DNA polymerase III subunit epsilon [Rhodospirillales bacterium RIFCSPLOWO2_12_FULL_58_28]
MREIALDTETTGLNYGGDDRIVEIGGVELLNHIATGRTFQCYVNPERDVPEGAFRVHGLSREFLSKHSAFADVADGFLEFIGDSVLVIHNAGFDLGFINAELKRLGRAELPMERVIDTVKLARNKFPGAQANLDALCRRFAIDVSDRELHGALKDARLLAAVYLELVGGRQPDLELAAIRQTAEVIAGRQTPRPPRLYAPTPEEEAAHANFLEKLDSPVWRR